jgi:hypothetical protein
MYLHEQLKPILTEIYDLANKHIEAIDKIKMEIIKAQKFEDAEIVNSIEKQIRELIDSSEKIINMK